MPEKPQDPRPRTAKKLSQSIRDAMDSRGWKQPRTEKESAIPQTTLSNWLAGELDNKVDRLRALAAALGVTLGELLGDPVPTPDLQPGSFIVDLDAYDRIAATGKQLPEGQVWYTRVPVRRRICTPAEYYELDDQLSDQMSRGRRRNKG